MTKIYIDTNIFLDFYQSTKDRISVFQEIEKHSKSIVLTEQTVSEFRRNKNARLNELSRNIKKTSSVTVHTTALVQSLPEYKAWCEAKRNAEKLAQAVSTKLVSWTQDEASDPVNLAFEKLVKESTLFRTSPAAIEKAKTRKLLGEPPTSPDKHTIGDELIWESILESCREDLIIVSRDKTFIDNVELLKVGYKSSTGAELLSITSKLGDAFELVGVPSETIDKADREVEEVNVGERYPFPLTLSTKCPKCGGELEETGYEGGDGDSAWWVFCTRCGSDYFPDQFA